MTPQQLRAALFDLCAEVSSKACAHVILSNSYDVSASLQPEGILGKVTLNAKSDTWDGLVPALRAAWDEHRDLHASNTKKLMALAIIRITAEHGVCTDRDLRMDFDQMDVTRYGDDAAALATEMGGNGPFEVVRVGSGNMAEAA